MDPITRRVFTNFQPISNANSVGTKSPASYQRFSFEQARKQDSVTDTPGAGSYLKQPEQLAETWKVAGSKLAQLTLRLSALPKTTVSETIRTRLTQIDSLYQNLGAAIDETSASATPGQLLKLQKDMYRLSEHLELISRVLDQLTNGVKSILQMQL